MVMTIISLSLDDEYWGVLIDFTIEHKLCYTTNCPEK